MCDLPSEIPIIGCVFTQKQTAGFALPVLCHPSIPTTYLVQDVDELSNMVRGYRVLEDAGNSIFRLFTDARSKIGQEVIHVFFTDNANAHVGSAQQLAPVLRDFVSRHRDLNSIVLQIYELIGTNNEKKLARANMQQQLLRQSGTQVAKTFYEGSILRSVLWSCLLEKSANENIARRVLELRSAIKASIDEHGALVLDLSALKPEDRSTFDEKLIVEKILLEFALVPASVAGEFAQEDVHNFEDVQEQVQELLRIINQTSRQEERAAILLDSILEDPRVGLTAVLQYGDRAETAKWVINEVRSKLVNHYKNSGDAELFIAGLIPKLFTRHYPLSRGELLYYLSRHLAKWPRVNESLQQSLNKTGSIFVDNWREQIQHNLTNEKTKPSS